MRSTELPIEVRTKLRKLDRLEGRYQELLKAYKNAHARVQQIEPFEASLRENTPLTSINDPSALVEYLNQSSLKTDMVVNELKRVSADRESQKKKFDESEKTITQLTTEIEALRQSAVGDTTEEQIDAAVPPRPSIEVHTDASDVSATPTTGAIKSPTNSISSRVPSFSLFSPKVKAKSPPPKDNSEDVFSYDTELPLLETKLQQRDAEIAALKQQADSLRGDLAVARESTSSMVDSLETATRELHTLRETKDKFDESRAKWESQNAELQARADKAEQSSAKLSGQLQNLQQERQENGEPANDMTSQINDLQATTVQLKSSLEEQRQLVQSMATRLQQKDATVKDLEDSLAMHQSAARQEKEDIEQHESMVKRLAMTENILATVRTQLKASEDVNARTKQELATKDEDFATRPSTKLSKYFWDSDDILSTIGPLDTREDVRKFVSSRLDLIRSEDIPHRLDQDSIAVPQLPASSLGGKKKKSKKKKIKGGAIQEESDTTSLGIPVKVTEDLAEAEEEHSQSLGPTSGSIQYTLLQEEINKLKDEISTKDTAIDRLSQSVKDQESLQEEIETLRDDLLHQGEGHVEARDKLKEALSQKMALEDTVKTLEKEQADLRHQLQNGVDSTQRHTELLSQFEELKDKATALQTDLAAAEALASARFKDLTELREIVTKAQPELKNLRSEVTGLRSTKEELRHKTSEFSRMEAKHEDLKSEMKGLSKRLGDKDTEVKELNHKIEQESTTRTRVEEDIRVSRSELKYSEARRADLAQERDNLSHELAKLKEDATLTRTQINTLEASAHEHSRQLSSLHEEINLKTALHTTSQSLVQSLRDQTHELSTQAREASSRAENLEEELGEAQRLLSERTRESQTMRMLLSQAETGTENRLRDMRERMESAVEERDRIEDEAGVGSRRMTREVEELRGKVRDLARSVRELEGEKMDFEGQQREWRRKEVELGKSAEVAEKDVNEVKKAMASLKEALDLSEAQIREMGAVREKLRRDIEEGRERVESLTKQNKGLSEEVRSLQTQNQSQTQTAKGKPPTAATRGIDSGAPSSRSSLDSIPLTKASAGGIRSPQTLSSTANMSNIGIPATAGGKGSSEAIDYVYLKNVLLQFLEQKDKNYQKQLIPVLGMLLKFDKGEEGRLVGVVNSR